MSSTHRREIKRSYGEGDDFTLYIFEEDLEMIERWFTRWNSTGKERPSGSYLYGLLTNTLNPVCHLVFNANDIPPEEYHFINNPQFEKPQESPLFRLIGIWSFEQPTQDVSKKIKVHQNTSILPRRFVFLTVEQIEQDHFAYHPHLFIKEEQELGKGRIDLLQGQNPYRLPNSSLNGKRKEQMGETITTGQVSSMRYKFEALTDANGSQMSMNSPARYNPPESTSYASVAQQGIRGNRSRETDHKSTKNTLFTSHRETPLNPQEISKEQKSHDVLPYSRTAQWYDTQPDVLKSTLDFVRTLAHDQNTVNITRNKTTQDMTITLEHHNYEWSIEFPSDFPNGTVKIRKKFKMDRTNCFTIKGLGGIDIFKAEVGSTLQGQCVQCKPKNVSSCYYSNYSFPY